MTVYNLKHFDKAATIDHMKHVVREYPIEILGTPDVATLEIAADAETAKQFVEEHPHWDMQPKI